MKTRAITGVLFVIILVASMLLGPCAFSIFFLLIALLSLDEFYRIINAGVKKDLELKNDSELPETDKQSLTSTNKHINVNRWAGIALATALFVCLILVYLNNSPIYTFLFSIPFLTLIFWLELFRKRPKPFSNIAFALLGIIYAVVPFMFFFQLGFLEGSYNYQYPLGFLILLWASDTGAYLAGMSFGKTKLFERHSPKKTWEGSFGGLGISLIAAFILSRYFHGIETWQWLISSAIIVAFGTYGDLTESMLKRSYNIKDSGNIMPGHGGFLDRFDGLLLAAPLVYLFLYLSNIG